MSPLLTQSLLPLGGAFALGLLIGWLTKQLFTIRTTRRLRETWEKRLRRQQHESEAAQLSIRNHVAQIQTLEEHLKEATSTLAERDVAIATAAQEMEAKITEFATLATQAREAREKEAETAAALSEERQLAQSLEHEVQTLRRNLADQAESHLQLSQRLQDLERQSTNIRGLEATHRTQRTRFETIIRTKDIELQQLQNRLAALEAQVARLTENNRTLRHSCAYYQSTLNEKETELVRLRDHLNTLGHPVSTPVTQPPDVRTHMDTRDKDVEIARLRARVAGLQLLLRRGPARFRTVPPKASLNVAKSDTP